MLPDGAPDELADREKLWNAVEAGELRKDAQLAREIEVAIPRELDRAEGIRLAREFVKAEFVDRGMIVDLNVHWDIGTDGLAKPHAHVVLTTRSIGEDAFGPKVRNWNATALLEQWLESYIRLASTTRRFAHGGDRTARSDGWDRAHRSTRRALTRPQHAPDISSSPAKGMIYAIPFAIVLWTLLAWAVRALI